MRWMSEVLLNGDIGIVLAILANAVLSCFWLASYIYTNPSLLVELREEVAPLLSVPLYNNSKSAPVITFDITRLLTHYPLWMSTFHEVLRLAIPKISGKAVLSDTTISSPTHSYLLKKGAIVQIPGGIVNTSERVLGADAKAFNTWRFMDVPHAEARYPRSHHVFGDGVTLCPGRHFARTQIIGLIAMLVSAYDIVSVGKEGWRVWRMGLRVRSGGLSVGLLREIRSRYADVLSEISVTKEEDTSCGFNIMR